MLFFRMAQLSRFSEIENEEAERIASSGTGAEAMFYRAALENPETIRGIHSQGLAAHLA